VNRLEPEWLDVLLERARQIRVLVVGDLMLDVYLRGSASRISPEAPVPVVRVRERWSTLGGAANVARNVVELGAACELVGCVGADEAGTQLLAEVERAGIGARGITVVADRPTTVKTRLVARNQQIARFDSEVEDDLEGGSADALIAAIDELAAGADVIVLEDYDKGVLTRAVSAAALEAARRRGVPVVVDPKERHFFDYAGATVFKPNLVELTTALRAPVHADDPRWMEETRRRLGCRNLLVTLGEDGLALATEAGEFVRVPTVARSVYDVSGAGDTVTAVVAVALAAGATLPEAAVLANHAAGIQVGKAGVSAVSADELRATVRAYQKV
jgi:rfaE bifunctional protein kinase chain/domain